MVENRYFCSVALLLAILIALVTCSQNTSTPEPLRCTRDYQCPSKCDLCRSGICTHPRNLPCTRDYQCPPCEVCRSGKCIEGKDHRSLCTPEDAKWTCARTDRCEANGKCIRNVCNVDTECGDGAECRAGICVYF